MRFPRETRGYRILRDLHHSGFVSTEKEESPSCCLIAVFVAILRDFPLRFHSVKVSILKIHVAFPQDVLQKGRQTKDVIKLRGVRSVSPVVLSMN